MAHTKDSTVVTQAIIDLLQVPATKAALGVKEVYYGAQELIPDYPAVEVESFPKERTLSTERATLRQFHITIRVGIMVLFGKVQSSEINKKEAESLIERIENKLHEDFTLGGLVIAGFVTRVEPGVIPRQGVMLRASRLVWEARSREVF